VKPLRPARPVRAAFVFLTRLPVGGFPYDDAEWRWAPAHFPLVGAILGAAAGAIDAALQPLGAWAAATFALGASLLLTGAFHEDGFADTADALGGGYDKEKVLAILKDSRVGAFGACAIGISLLGRAALLVRLGAGAPWGWVLAASLARVAPTWQIAGLPYVSGAQSRSRGVMQAGWSQAIVATAWSVAIAGVLVAEKRLAIARIAAALACVTAVGLVTSVRYMKRLGGVTGDFLGATEQLGEMAVLAALAWGAA
jgi:adenosylcobinamide-GDP ribazoletransferase